MGDEGGLADRLWSKVQKMISIIFQGAVRERRNGMTLSLTIQSRTFAVYRSAQICGEVCYAGSSHASRQKLRQRANNSGMSMGRMRNIIWHSI